MAVFKNTLWEVDCFEIFVNIGLTVITGFQTVL